MLSYFISHAIPCSVPRSVSYSIPHTPFRTLRSTLKPPEVASLVDPTKIHASKGCSVQRSLKRARRSKLWGNGDYGREFYDGPPDGFAFGLGGASEPNGRRRTSTRRVRYQ